MRPDVMEKGVKVRYFEGCGQEGPVLCIFLCEFHSTYGPKISCQVPKDFISKETFESVNVYLIPKPQLIQSIITVTLDDIKIVGYPVRIQNEKYPRNAFYYNLCFVCNSWARTNQYDQVVKDLSAFLRQLEEDENLLSRLDDGGDSTRVTTLFNQVLSDLNSSRVSCLQEGKRSVVLRVGRPREVEVPRGSVPVLRGVVEPPAALHRDPTLLQVTAKILPYMDGLNSVERIVNLADVELDLVEASLQNLVSDGVIKLVPEYSDTNVYVVTFHVRSLLLDKQLQADCLACVSLPGGSLASVRDVMRVYTLLNRGATVRDLCLRMDLAQMRIDERKLVQFGLLHGLLRKLNQHINYVRVENKDGAASGEGEAVSSALDGIAPFETACARTGLTRQQLDHHVHSNPAFVSIYK